MTIRDDVCSERKAMLQAVIETTHALFKAKTRPTNHQLLTALVDARIAQDQALTAFEFHCKNHGCKPQGRLSKADLNVAA